MKLNPDDQPRNLVLSAILSVIATVLILDGFGYIRHISQASELLVSEFSSITIDPAKGFNMSNKPSGQVAKCINGFLFVASKAGDRATGLLVNQKRQGIQCSSKGL